MPRLADPAMRTPAGGGGGPPPGRARPRRVTVRSLAGDVGASTQVVYTHFDGLDDVLAEVWREGFRRFGWRSTRRRSPTTRWRTGWSRGGGYRRFALAQPAPLPGDVRRRAPRQVRHGRAEDAEAAGGHVRRSCSSASSAAWPRGGGRSTTSGRPARSSGRRCTGTCSSSCPGTTRASGAIAAPHLRGATSGVLRARASATTPSGSRRSLDGGPASGPRRPGCSDPKLEHVLVSC